ncbi:MAG: crotonase/enoyl-CoA hydratase family protein [Hyphomicrobiales bacterium]
MTDFETIRLDEADNGIATLTLARPEKHNALNAQMIAELTQAAHEIAERETIRAVILTGEGKSFCAGGDLNWMREQAEKPDDEKVAEGMKLATMLRALDDLPKPLIAKVQGNAFGGGVGMMCVSDIVVAASHIKWGLTETRLGLIPATIGPYVVRRLGEGHARRCFMNSKIFGAEIGQQLGLISDIVTAEVLEESALLEAKAFLSCAPGAVASSKDLAKYLARSTGDPMEYTADRLAERWANDECANGIQAFFNKSKAPWVVE